MEDKSTRGEREGGKEGGKVLRPPRDGSGRGDELQGKE